jgi:hypothetical protein
MTSVRISLDLGCSDRCDEFAAPLLSQLSHGYEECSVLPIVPRIEDWRSEHRTARKRSDRSWRLGYRFVEILRHEHADDLHAINTSTSHRQGRPMSDGYWQRPSITPDPIWGCARHGVHPYGVLSAGSALVAYLWLYRAGDLALVSQILGHADHLRNDVMYLLMQGMLERERLSPGYVVYNRHDSGTDGLRYFKERIGFERTRVVWG